MTSNHSTHEPPGCIPTKNIKINDWSQNKHRADATLHKLVLRAVRDIMHSKNSPSIWIHLHLSNYLFALPTRKMASALSLNSPTQKLPTKKNGVFLRCGAVEEMISDWIRHISVVQHASMLPCRNQRFGMSLNSPTQKLPTKKNGMFLRCGAVEEMISDWIRHNGLRASVKSRIEATPTLLGQHAGSENQGRQN
jgi:hypothetical protein